MAVNRFVLNGISYHGHGAINEIPGIVASKGFKKAFVASDPDLVKFGVTAKVTDLLKANGIDFELYTDIKPNPTIENVQNGVAAFQASGADFMITIGGGSSMDTGKGIGISALLSTTLNSRMSVLWKVSLLQRNVPYSPSRFPPQAEQALSPPSTMLSPMCRRRGNSSA